MDDDDFSVEDSLLHRDIERIGDYRETAGPIVTVAGIDRGALVEVNLQSVAVVLDFMQPCAADGSPGSQRSELGGDESRHFRRDGSFDHPRDEAGLCTLGHYANSQNAILACLLYTSDAADE